MQSRSVAGDPIGEPHRLQQRLPGRRRGHPAATRRARKNSDRHDRDSNAMKCGPSDERVRALLGGRQREADDARAPVSATSSGHSESPQLEARLIRRVHGVLHEHGSECALCRRCPTFPTRGLSTARFPGAGLFRQIDQDDIRVLPRTVEHDGFPVRRNVESP